MQGDKVLNKEYYVDASCMIGMPSDIYQVLKEKDRRRWT